MLFRTILRPKHSIPILFFTFFLVLGLSIVGDYGISWDEEWQHTNAMVSAKYVNEIFPFTDEEITDWELSSYWNRHHGVFFTLSVYFLERVLDYNMEEDYRKIFKLRHDLVFLLFWLSCIVFYLIGKFRFNDWRWALAGSLCLILSPRIFGHAFFNPKDIVVLAFYVFSTYSLLGILRYKKWQWAVLHALFCAMLISSRIAGVIVPAITLMFILADLINERFRAKLLRQYGLILLVFLPLVFGFTVAFWPLLWKAPYNQFMGVFETMSEYGWGGKVLFQGQFLSGDMIPWYYVPVWMGITTPVLYLLFGIAGIFMTLWSTIEGWKNRRFIASDEVRTDLLFLALFLGAPLAVIYKGAVVYDGWRHLYFIYPSFLLLALVACQHIYQWLIKRKFNRFWGIARQVLTILIVTSLCYTTWFLMRYHPHQHVYFSELKWGKSQLGAYELDYWGTSYKQGLEALAKIDNRDVIRVACGSYPGELNWRYLRPHLQPRFVLVEKYEEADYYISNFRHWEHGMGQYREKRGPYQGEEVYQIWVGATKIFGIYKVEPSISE